MCSREICLCGPLLLKLRRQLVARFFSVCILLLPREERERWAELEAFDFCDCKLTKYSFLSSDVTPRASVSHLSSVTVATGSVARAEVSQSRGGWAPYGAGSCWHPSRCSIHVGAGREKSCCLHGLPFTCVNKIFWAFFSFLNLFGRRGLSQTPASPRSPARGSGILDSERAIGNSCWGWNRLQRRTKPDLFKRGPDSATQRHKLKGKNQG